MFHQYVFTKSEPLRVFFLKQDLLLDIANNFFFICLKLIMNNISLKVIKTSSQQSETEINKFMNIK